MALVFFLNIAASPITSQHVRRIVIIHFTITLIFYFSVGNLRQRALSHCTTTLISFAIGIFCNYLQPCASVNAKKSEIISHSIFSAMFIYTVYTSTESRHDLFANTICIFLNIVSSFTTSRWGMQHDSYSQHHKQFSWANRLRPNSFCMPC